METKKLIFITGGARSGKSSFAEKLAVSEAEKLGGELHYIATSMAEDEEMAERIARHQRDRLESGAAWKTWECPVDIRKMAIHFSKSDVVLLDCLTVLLSNELFRKHPEKKAPSKETIYKSIWEGIQSITASAHTLLLVSNEVLTEPLSDNTTVRSYAYLLGKLHQTIVKHADQAYLAEAGTPILMKGRCQG
jgi:adenosylcobinamide kinase/adenosylcobinamide-phosphate guanylyltransferase